MEQITSFDVWIDEDEMTGVDMISLVRRPAIMEDFITMEDEQADLYKQVVLSEDDKQIITGPALIPDIEIIRKDDDGTPFYIRYSRETIEKIAQKFAKLRSNHSINKDHKKDKMAEKTFIYESWITGGKDKSSELGFDVPEGTWMVSLKVEDDQLWQEIKSGKYKGFSIEGLFKFKKSNRKIKQECTCGEVQLESYSDYPEGAKNNAKRALEWAEKNGWGDCGTSVGKTRANQLANGEAISEETIARMSAFRRHQQNKDVPYSEGCGGLMWDCWGGDAGIRWAENKLKEIRQKVEMAGEPGLVHPNCRCSIRRGEFRLSKPRTGKNGQPVPCEICKKAKQSWDGAGFFEDVFEFRYDNTKQSLFDEKEKDEDNYNIDMIDKKININMASAILADGKTLHTDADTMSVGVEVYFKEGDQNLAVDNGEYEMEDGTIVVVEESKIKEIKDETDLGYNKDKEEMGKDKKEEEMGKDKKEEKMEMDPMLTEQFDAIKGMIENLNLKIDALIGAETEDLNAVKQSLVGLEEKVEKISVNSEMKSVESIDDLKKVAQESQPKRRLDYDLIRKYNKKF